MNQEILAMVEGYRQAISTQREEDFLPLWNEQAQCTLISPSGYYVGLQSISRDFLQDRIGKAYSRIELITKNIDVRIVGDCAIVVFSYSTDCTLRSSGEAFGIAGLETQVYNRIGESWKLTHVHYSADRT